MHKFTADISHLHQFPVYLITGKLFYADVLRRLVFIQAIPHVGIDKVRSANRFPIIGHFPGTAGYFAVFFHNLLMYVQKLVPFRSVMDKMHAHLRADEP